MGYRGANPECGPIGQGPWIPGPSGIGLVGPHDDLGAFILCPGCVTGNCPMGPGIIPKGPLGGSPLRGSLLGGAPIGGPIGPIPKCSASGVGWPIKGLPGAWGGKVLPCQGA